MKTQINSKVVVITTVLILGIWAITMAYFNKWSLFGNYWPMTLTMVFGSFIAGASAEGGGAVAFPVMTLLMKIPPDAARNFSLAIQSIGMTAASILIISRGIKVNWSYLKLASIGGAIGIILGTYFILPHIAPEYVKILFVSFWLSFGFVLYYVNEIDKRNTTDTLPRFNLASKTTMVLVGILGGTLSSLLGSGLDIFSFSYITMRYRLSEKVATPTSVVIMAINSIVGFILHSAVIRDFEVVEMNYWLVSIPVVIIGAPLGAYFINQKTRQFISRFLYLIIVVQFLTAYWIIGPTGNLLLFSIGCFGIGLFIFFGFSALSKKYPVLR